MNQRAFERLVAEFIETWMNEDDEPPGRFLVRVLGERLVAVGLAYHDAVASNRFLQVVDTRSAREMFEWPKRTARAWTKRNREVVPDELWLKLFSSQVPEEERLDFAEAWPRIVDSLELADVGFWGPDPVGNWDGGND